MELDYSTAGNTLLYGKLIHFSLCSEWDFCQRQSETVNNKEKIKLGVHEWMTACLTFASFPASSEDSNQLIFEIQTQVCTGSFQVWQIWRAPVLLETSGYFQLLWESEA